MVAKLRHTTRMLKRLYLIISGQGKDESKRGFNRFGHMKKTKSPIATAQIIQYRIQMAKPQRTCFFDFDLTHRAMLTVRTNDTSPNIIKQRATSNATRAMEHSDKL